MKTRKRQGFNRVKQGHHVAKIGDVRLAKSMAHALKRTTSLPSPSMRIARNGMWLTHSFHQWIYMPETSIAFSWEQRRGFLSGVWGKTSRNW